MIIDYYVINSQEKIKKIKKTRRDSQKQIDFVLYLINVTTSDLVILYIYDIYISIFLFSRSLHTIWIVCFPLNSYLCSYYVYI